MGARAERHGRAGEAAMTRAPRLRAGGAVAVLGLVVALGAFARAHAAGDGMPPTANEPPPKGTVRVFRDRSGLLLGLRAEAATLAEIDERAAEVRRALAFVSSLPDQQPGRESGIPLDHDRAAATDHMGDLLDAVGTAVFLGASDTARDRLGDLLDSRAACDLAAAAVSRLIEESLSPALSGLMNDIYELVAAEDGDRECLEERIVDALAERDRVELAMEGARLLCGCEPELDDDSLAALASFDDLLRAELWRTLPLGDRRAARCAWAAPRYRERLWWWFRGCDLPHTT